ncbi:MAG: pseudaminic acid synthase [Kofleriaceae bacterium]
MIAELSGNHGHDYDRAARIIDAAAQAGADAVKLQTYTPDTLTIDCDKPAFRIAGDGAWGGKTLYQLYAEAMTPWEWHPRLFQVAADCGIEIFSSPFDVTAVAQLADLGVRAYKIASFELVDLPLVAAIASQGRPVIASTGMANLAEIHDAVETIRRAGAPGLALLHCVSAYPASPAEMNLATIPHLAQAFGCVVGLSDHTLSDTSAVLAVGLGASLVEKHVTMHRADGGPDAHFSLEPHELARLVTAIREAEAAVGTPSYARTASELQNEVFRRSLFVVRDVAAGEPLTAENVRSIRPGGGLPPKFLPLVLGRRARVAIERGTALTWEML